MPIVVQADQTLTIAAGKPTGGEAANANAPGTSSGTGGVAPTANPPSSPPPPNGGGRRQRPNGG
jgi:hypothetical protein